MPLSCVLTSSSYSFRKIGTERLFHCCMFSIKGTLGYKNKLIFIDSLRLLRTNGDTFIFTKKLGNKIVPGQFGPASLLPLFQCPQAWPQVLISDLVDQSSGLSIVVIRNCVVMW